MNWPSYGRNVLRPLLRGAVKALDPPPSRICILLDRRAEGAARPRLEAGLEGCGHPVDWIRWWPSEEKKTLAQAEEFARRIVRHGVDRNALLLGVGGGVTTDLTGFLAALLLRGLRWCAVPTTLLGMVDAALGGKTAVDLPEGKNLLGAFHPPEFVLCDVDVLATLPPREWRCGLGEVLKTALIGGQELLALLENAEPDALLSPSDGVLAVARGAGEIKMRIVEADPTEQGDRKVLNLGHTFGHALEAAAGYRKLAHGEAVALGLLCALRMSEELGLLEKGLSPRVRKLTLDLGLPQRYPGPLPSRKELAALMKRDKKARNGKLDLVLPITPGECLLVTGVEPPVAVSALHRELAD